MKRNEVKPLLNRAVRPHYKIATIMFVSSLRSKPLNQHRVLNGRSGLTLIDVTITVLLIGIIAAVAVPKFVNTLQRHRVAAAAKKVRIDLELARKLAMTRSSSQTVSFSAGRDAYLLDGIDNPVRVGQPYLITLSDYPYQCQLVGTALGNDQKIVFDRFGRPDSGGTVTVQAGSFQQTITIDPNTGHASVP